MELSKKSQLTSFATHQATAGTTNLAELQR